MGWGRGQSPFGRPQKLNPGLEANTFSGSVLHPHNYPNSSKYKMVLCGCLKQKILNPAIGTTENQRTQNSFISLENQEYFLTQTSLPLSHKRKNSTLVNQHWRASYRHHEKSPSHHGTVRKIIEPR